MQTSVSVVALRDRLARQRDDPLHEVVDPGVVPLLVRRGREHDDVAAVHVVEVVAQLVDEDPVPIISVGSIDSDGM